MALSTPREAALKVLVSVEKDGAYLNLALEEELAHLSDERDRGLASRLAIGVLRNRAYIDNIIVNLSSVKLKKLSVWILNILRIGIYSVKLTDKIPVSATVNECVKLSRRYGHSASAGYVNAVLRKSAQCGDFLEKLSGDELLAVKYSLPLWLVAKWRREEPEYEALMAAMNAEPPTLARLNTDEIPTGFEPTDISPYSLKYSGSGSITASEAYKNGLVTVQDGASQLCVLSLGIKKGQKMLDLCAAPGGKSVFAAYLGAEVTACDLYEHKIRLIEANAKRLHVRIRAEISDALVLREDFVEAFDCVLADAPCSGLGIIRRKPDIKWNKEATDSDELAKIQQGVLNNAASYVRKGGRLVYSTCTLSRAENEGIVKWFLKNHPEFEPSPLGIEQAHGEASLRLRPDIHNTDGFFIAAFRKNEG